MEYGLTLVDIGGTWERLLVVGVDDKGKILGDIITKKVIATPVRNLPTGDVDYFYDKTAECIKAVQHDANTSGVKVLPLVCVGTPGRLVNGKIAPGTAGNLGKSFDNVSPGEELSRRLNQNVHVINDAIAQMGAGLDELLRNPDTGRRLRGKNVCYIGLGTGLGGGFVRINGRLECFTDGHIFDIMIPGYTGTMQVEFAKTNVIIQSRFAEDLLSGRAIRQIACAMDRYLIGHGKGPVFLPLVADYERMTKGERAKALEHDNNKSPVDAKLINGLLGRKEMDEKRKRALPAARTIANFEGKMLGRLIGCIYQGNIEKATKEARWSQEDIEKVKGTTDYIIGGSVGTKGAMGEIIRKTAIETLGEKFPDTDFNLFTAKQTENAGALGTAAFLGRDDLMDAMKGRDNYRNGDYRVCNYHNGDPSVNLD